MPIELQKVIAPTFITQYGFNFTEVRHNWASNQFAQRWYVPSVAVAYAISARN